MRIKSVKSKYISKKLKNLSPGDKVLSTDGGKASILNIQKNGIQPTYTVKLSDGRSFRAGKGHFNTVHFRNSKQRPDKKVYDVLTVEYIKDHLDKYLFEIPTDDTFSLKEIDFWQHLEMLPCHEYEPVDEADIVPDFTKDLKKVYIEAITPSVEEECWCLQLNDPLGMFNIEDGIFTHNSLLTNLILAYEIVLFGLMRKPFQVLGHSQPVYENVELPNGKYTTINDLKKGMKIAGVTQKESEIMDIIEQGEKDTYELSFEDNTKCRCSLDHLWTVYDSFKNCYVVLPTKQILEHMDRYLFPEEEDCVTDKDLILDAENLFEKNSILSHVENTSLGFSLRY